MPRDGQLTVGSDWQSLIDQVTAEVWRNPAFQELLFTDSAAALTQLFGRVPPGLEGVTFKPQPVDRFRIRRNDRGGRDITVRPRSAGKPITTYTRTVRGLPEVVLVLYTKRCRWQCTMCVLPLASSLTIVDKDDIGRQVDAAFDLVDRERFPIQQVTIGNEGSPLDASTLPADDLEMVLRRCASYPGVRSIVIETRAEFATEEILDRVQGWIAPCRLMLKIGLESADDDIRENILRKRMDLGMFEQAVRRMGRRGIGLSSYVLLKASPWHDDAQGRADAIATCDYLTRLCREAGAELDLRLNAMYMAQGSRWADWAAEAGWTPPSISDLAAVLLEVAKPGVVVYAGLSEEGLAVAGGHYEARADYLPEVRELLERFNETGDPALLRRAVACQASTPAGDRPRSLYEQARARLGPVTGLVSAPRVVAASGGSAVFVALADYAAPPGSPSRTGFGAGWTLDEASGRAVLEAYERRLTTAGPDEPPIPTAGPAALDAPAYWIGTPADEGTQSWHCSTKDGPVVEWVPAHSLTGQLCFVPHAHCRRLPAGHPDLQLVKYEPSGAAVAFTRPEAILHGFAEVVERDAAAIWWQARLTVPAVDLDTVDCGRIQRFVDEQRSLGRQVWMLDITSGVGVPVFILFVQEAGQPPVFGMACHPSKYQAARAAVLETGQALCYAQQERQKWSLSLQGMNFWEPHGDVVDWNTIPDAGPGGYQRLAGRAGLTLVVHDLPQLCEGLAGVKVIVPGLCGLSQPARCARLREEAARRGIPSELDATGEYNLAPFPV